MKRILAAAGLTLGLSALLNTLAFASSEGTLPLKLRGSEGTLPLRMSGQAQNVANPGQVPAQMILTQATQPALDPVSGANLHCQLAGNNVSKHSAQGTITVASGTFTVTGICYNHDTKVMEVVGVRGGAGGVEQSFMSGQLLVETPKEFSGRLTVAGTAPAHYTFAVKCDDVNPR